ERGRRKEPEEGRSQKKYFYKYEMLPFKIVEESSTSQIHMWSKSQISNPPTQRLHPSLKSQID
ncbi:MULTISPECIES: hypothetical protein, partial [unclassified Microcoleus]